MQRTIPRDARRRRSSYLLRFGRAPYVLNKYMMMKVSATVVAVMEGGNSAMDGAGCDGDGRWVVMATTTGGCNGVSFSDEERRRVSAEEAGLSGKGGRGGRGGGGVWAGVL
ncbi:hypothetical protein RHSIM_Rhsim01G0108300 [Rhododendron simsii]|uniref:Uncharacterized protein n=1 Tax=Rhododendron simsii TaxID=118357 RepID=A0A834LVH1_RHOSS|nr:hypothetical protein RHSIM_Rhsim01G0108300 [Rhododendron simsii]